LRLEQAVRYALDNNERSKKAPLRVESAAGSLDRARGAFLPSLTAGGSGQYRLQEDRTGRNTTTSGTITLSQPILSPSAFPSYSQASHQLESEKWGSVQDRRVLAFDTARAFLQALTTERVLEAATRRLERAKANLENAEARAAAGLASVNDATRAALELTTSAREVTTAEGRVGTAYLNLGYLMNRPIAPAGAGAPSPLAQPERTTTAAEQFESKPDDQVRAALERRPDLRAQHERTEALHQSAKEPLYRLAPTVGASAAMRVLPDPLPTERGHEETITLNLTWNIFDAGFRYADRRTRLAQAESQSLDESLLRRTIDNDIRVALVSLNAARQAFKIAEDAVAMAQKSGEETEILYRQGLARAIELTDATARRFDAEVTRASAKLTMEQAYLELRFALGFGPVDDSPSSGPANGEATAK
jgi:outer membrane protein TolC